MKKITVISDSHGNRAAIEKLFPIFSESDCIIHLGDTSADGAYVSRNFPGKTHIVNGNCDQDKLGEDELILKFEDVNIFACHGDKFGVRYGYDRLAYKARQENCKVALFGHTHCATEFEIDGITLLNPGTLARYSQNTYLYLVINGDKVVAKICDFQ